MNQKKFQKKLKDSYKNNFVMPIDIDILYNSDKKSLFNNESVSDLIMKNFDELISHVPKDNLHHLIKRLIQIPELEMFIEDKFFDILEYSYDYVIDDILKIDYKFDVLEKINNNFKKVLEKCNIKKLMYINSKFNLTDENRKLLNETYSNNEIEFIKMLFHIEDNKSLNLNYEKEKKSSYDILKMIVDEILKNENKELVDIKELGSGNYSSVIQIGDKVMKVGIGRNTFDIPNSKYILQPILRRNFKDISDVNITVEVSDRVDTKISISSEGLYQFYKKIREEGIIWADANFSNLGMLLKDNKIYWNNNISDFPEARGLVGENNVVLKKGEYVILDTDFIYRENDENIIWGNETARGFEERYKEELKKSKENKPVESQMNEINQIEEQNSMKM